MHSFFPNTRPSRHEVRHVVLRRVKHSSTCLLVTTLSRGLSDYRKNFRFVDVIGSSVRRYEPESRKFDTKALARDPEPISLFPLLFIQISTHELPIKKNCGVNRIEKGIAIVKFLKIRMGMGKWPYF